MKRESVALRPPARAGVDLLWPKQVRSAEQRTEIQLLKDQVTFISWTEIVFKKSCTHGGVINNLQNIIHTLNNGRFRNCSILDKSSEIFFFVKRCYIPGFFLTEPNEQKFNIRSLFLL